MKKIIASKTLARALFVLAALATPLLFPLNLSASADLVISVTVSEAMTVLVDTSSYNPNDTTGLAVIVTTNSPGGYRLIMSSILDPSVSTLIRETSAPTNSESTVLTLSDYGATSPDAVIFTAIPK